MVLALPDDCALPGGVVPVLFARPRFPAEFSMSRLLLVVPATSFNANVAKPDGFLSRVEVPTLADCRLDARLALLPVSGGG